MLEWLHRKKPAPLAGAPEARRHKSYSAQSGYVYQYFYEGYRAAQSGHEAGTQYVFQVSADRKTYSPVSVFLPDAVAAAWESAHRGLSSTERYAVAKMALFQAFDERERPEQMKLEILVRAADLEAILDTLGLD